MKTLIFYTTTDCNHKCNHCCLVNKGTWDVNQLLTAISVLKENYRIIINGAEPLTHPELLTAYKAANQKFIFSNGKVFLSSKKDDYVNLLKQNGIEILRISNHFQSADSLNAISFSELEMITKYLQQNGFVVEYNSTVTSENYMLTEKNCDYAYGLGIHKIKFFPLTYVGNAKYLDNSLYLSTEQLRCFYNDIIRKIRNKYGLDELEIRLMGDFSLFSPKFKCYFGNDNYVIAPDRKIYGCIYSFDYAPIGYLSDNCEIIINTPSKTYHSRCILDELPIKS